MCIRDSLVVALGGGGCSGANVPASTVERTALPAGSVNETGYFTDEDGDWIHDPAKLERGLRHFYEETGVQPYVYILPNGSVRSYQELQSIAPVSYTHLDVYKRQRVARLGSHSGPTFHVNTESISRLAAR